MLLITKRLSVALSYYALHYKVFVKRTDVIILI